MSKANKSGLKARASTAKSIVERAKREVPDFAVHYAKFEEQTTIRGYTSSTIFSYSRAVAHNGVKP